MKFIKYYKMVRAYIPRLFHLLLITPFFLFLPLFQLHAQSLGTVVTYQQNITSAEDGGKLSFPSFAMTDPATNEIYIVDGRSRITVYTSDFFPVHTMGKSDGIESPQGLAIDEKGYVYVVQAATEKNPKSRISVYNSCLKWERDIYINGIEEAEAFSPYRIAVDGKGNFYVAANYYPGVLYINSEGLVLDIIAPEKEGEKVLISSVNLDSEGKLYLVSEQQSHIYVYDENRTLLVKFGDKGGSSGKLSRPRGVGTDIKSGRMYVVDYMRHTVTVYNRKGEYIFEFGGMGWSEGWFQHPSYLLVDKLGRIIVADTFNQRVQVFNSW